VNQLFYSLYIIYATVAYTASHVSHCVSACFTTRERTEQSVHFVHNLRQSPCLSRDYKYTIRAGTSALRLVLYWDQPTKVDTKTKIVQKKLVAHSYTLVRAVAVQAPRSLSNFNHGSMLRHDQIQPINLLNTTRPYPTQSMTLFVHFHHAV